MPPNVKFPRAIKQGMMGKDVIGHKRAVSRARPDLYPWHDFSNYCGAPFMEAIVEWKQSRGMNNLHKLGATAHEVLERTHEKGSKEWAFDAVAIRLCQEYYDAVHAVTGEDAVRDKIVDSGFFWYSHRGGIGYSNFRPFQLGKPTWVPSRWDCSAFFTACHFAGGAPDPNGRHYDHLGYTGTLKDHGVRVSSVDQLKPGDAVFYGHSREMPGFNAGDPTHVAMYVGKHMVLSMGHYPMSYYEYDYRKDINHYRHYKVA